MTLAKWQWYMSLGDEGRKRQASEARKCLRVAWPHRRDLRARTVIRANVACLRELRDFSPVDPLHVHTPKRNARFAREMRAWTERETGMTAEEWNERIRHAIS